MTQARALTPEQVKRYSRHIIMPQVGSNGQRKLLDSKVLIIGAGGLGGPGALYLALAGVGTIGIADFDVVDMSNLQRQILHQHNDVGQRKVISAQKTINSYNPVYYISNKPAIVGGMVKNPVAKIAGPGSDNSGQWVINLSMTREGTRKWSNFTGKNVGRRVAIVLDNKVFMAPQINSKIPTGQTVISGLEDANEAQDIANVLSAGELAAPVKIVEERSVSPSLGRDSIQSGKNALMIAFIAVLIFILFYYKVSGLIANISLFLNVIFILSILSILGATLTLPGIAGLILTIGIAIDSNVIIFERIKEELSFGKNAMSAVRSGYKRAFITIMDANVTTLIAAFVLANIGSGPIKGFAITLSIGIICSMFTAIFITKTLFMILLKMGPKRS